MSLVWLLVALVGTHLPLELRKKSEIRRMRRVADTVVPVDDHGCWCFFASWLRPILDKQSDWKVYCNRNL